MHTVTALSLLALAGSAIAAPYGGGRGGGEAHVVYTTELYTVVVTANGPPPAQQTYAPKADKPKGHKPPKPQEPEVVYTTQSPPQQTQAPPQQTQAPPSYPQDPPKPSAEPEKPSATYGSPPPQETGGSSSGGSGYMAVVNQWRQKLGLKDLEHSQQLEDNASNTCDEGHGEMKHKLNPGTMGQVLAPGDMSKEFEHIFVGGWLCEMPNLPGLDGVCNQQSKGWTYAGQTGHAEILTSDQYSKIGCACVDGITGCDLA